MKRIKNSIGIWAFGPNATRFMPGGYHPQTGTETMEERTARASDGIGDIIDGFEFHYPQEINTDNVERLQKILGPSKDIYAIAMGLHCEPRFALSAYTNPNPEIRKEAIRWTTEAIDICADIGAKLIIWPGGEGYNYPFQCNYEAIWNQFIEGIQAAVEYANTKNVTIFLEHKNSEPAMNILMRNIGMTLFVINKIKSLGTDTSRLKVNMDWQHLIMNGENLAEYAVLLMSENLMGHHHANSGWGQFDDDNMAGSSFFMQTLSLAFELRRHNYGANGERVGHDLYPYTENQVEAAKRSILQWEFIYDLAGKINADALQSAKNEKDAIRSYHFVFEALGLTDDYIKGI